MQKRAYDKDLLANWPVNAALFPSEILMTHEVNCDHHVESMPIGSFLAGQPFEPETVREMSLALESVCETLRLRLIDNPATRLVAQKIIELRQRGIRGDRLCVMTLQAFQYDDE